MTGEDKNRRSSIRKSKKELYMEMAQKEIREMLKRNKNTGSSTTTSSKSKRELDLEMARKGKEIHKMLKRKASLSFSSVSQDPKKQKPIEDPKWMSMNIKLPSDFLIKDQLNSEDIFPHVNSFCLPTFRDRYKDMSIDDIDAHSVGLAYRSFQASLLLHSKMEEVKKLSTISVKKMEDAEAAKQLAEAKLEAKEREIRELKARLMDLTSRIQEAENSASIFKDGEIRAKAALAEKEEEVQKLKTLTETTTSCQRVIDHEKELEQVETYVRLKTRARIMCQYSIAKQKLQHSNITPSMQSQIQQQQQQQQQQNLLQPGHLQSSLQSVIQPTMMQTSSLSTAVQNQQAVVPQSSQPMIQHHQQSVLRQQRQQQQAPIAHQQQVQPSQQQQQQTQSQPNPMGQQANATNMQQNQLIGQQNNYSDMQQQQRLLGQQNKLSSVQQPQQHLIGQHNNLSSMQQQHLSSQTGGASGQQQQLLVTQSGNSSMQTNQHPSHMLQSKIPIQQQNQQSSATLLATQVQQSQPQLQQQVMSHIQTQSGQLQQQVGMQQQPNLLQRDMQQRLPTSGGFQQQNVIDQQKQLFQQQRPMPEASSTSLDSTAQTGNPNGGDWQEEVYQKIKAMKDLYLLDLNDMHQKFLGKLQQHDSLPQQPKNEQLEKLKVFKNMLERFMAFLQIPKHNILANYKDKLGTYEKQIVNVINSNRRKPTATQQQTQALPPPHLPSVQQSQQTHSQLTQVQPHETQMNSQMQTVNLQGSMAAMQQNNMGSLQQNSVSSVPGATNAQQNMMSSIQPNSNLDPGQNNSTMNSLQQVSGGSLQQNAVSGSQQGNINPLSSHSGMGTLQPNSTMLQHQHMKQQEQLLQSQQLKQFQHRQMQQQYMHKQQLLQQQQQQFHQQTKQQQQSGQLQGNQLSQLHQINDGSDIKLRQQMGMKSGTFQQHHAAAQRSAYHQQLKSGAPFSPQLLPAASPQMSQHPSPQIDQQNLFNSLTKPGTPLQSANSPFTVPSPATPSASPIPGELMNGVSSLSNGGNIGHQQPTAAVLPTQSLAIGTPGISASPLLAEFTSPDGNHGVVASIGSGKSSVTEQPLDRLLKVVKSISSKALSASVSDIGSVVSMIDRIAGSAPGNGSRAAVGEDLVAMTKCRLQARTFVTQDGNNGTRKMKRFTSAMPLNVVSSPGSVNDSFKQLNCAETSELDSTASSTIKRPRIETNHALLEEIKEINQGLIDTVVDISEEDNDPAAASEGGDGTVVKCSFCAVALGPNLKSQYASAQMSPIQPLRLLVPANYPNCSPILLDKFPIEVSKEYEDLSVKTKSRFSISLRSLSQPMSLKEIARTWDVCARAVISEYAQQSGGGTFSSKYGVWENCLSAA